jgi:hypothetical protein
MAITIVEQGGGQYHVLLIIADGQVFTIFFLLNSQFVIVERQVFFVAPPLAIHFKGFEC